ncbi:uncharacterized protein LOC141835741 [Curcuma longa]|uniref:uncharacterized protein LOC141835741 n=1 Tax=Curcuma longa TaxID=136217 RepID=UPI003D9F0BBF
MSTKVQSGEAVVVAAGDSKQEVVWTACACCGLTEECTPAYVARVRERFDGRWVCGLCGEAVMDEILRSGRRTSTAEALRRHRAFCESFRTAAPPPIDTAEHLIAAMRQLLRRSLDSPRAVRSTPNSPLRPAVAGTPAAVSDEGSELLLHSRSYP